MVVGYHHFRKPPSVCWGLFSFNIQSNNLYGYPYITESYHLVKLSYFTNLDFPEIRWFPLLFTTIWDIWGEKLVWSHDEIWPDIISTKLHNFTRANSHLDGALVDVSPLPWRRKYLKIFAARKKRALQMCWCPLGYNSDKWPYKLVSGDISPISL